MADDNDSTLSINVKDNKTLIISKKVSKISGFLNELDDTEDSIDILNIDLNILEKIYEFMTLYDINPMNSIVKPLKSSNLLEAGIQSEYVDYIKSMDMHTFFHVCNSAYFLLIRPLLDLCNAHIATMIKGKSALQLKDLFKIPGEYNPPNEQELRDKYKWAEYPDCNVPQEESSP
jgi:S-phase kinase-associated protein 1